MVWCFGQWHIGIDAFIPADESAMGIGKVFTETSHVALYGELSATSCWYLMLVQCSAILQQILVQLSLRNPCDIMFVRYSPSNCRMTLKLGLGHSRSSEVAPFGSSDMVSYSTSIATTATMVISCTVSKIHRLIGQKSHCFLLYLASPLGMKPSELSDDPRWWKTRMMGLSGGERISTKCSAV